MGKNRQDPKPPNGASGKKPKAGLYQQQLARQKAQQARQRRLTLIVAVVVVGLGVGAVFVVMKFMKPELPPPPVVVEKKPEPGAGQAEQMAEVEKAWEGVKGHEPTPGYKPLLEKGRSQLELMRSSWTGGKFVESGAAMDSLGKTVRAIETLDLARDSALVARQDAGKLAEEAKGHEAEKLVPTLWAEAQGKDSEAGKKFDADEFSAAAEGWRGASEAYGRAAVGADKAKAAGESRKAYEERLVKRFDRASIESRAAAALAEVNALLAAGDKSYTDLQFDEAKAKFDEATGKVPAVEVAVQQQIGAHYYAVLAGYKATDLLLLKAVGDPPGDARWAAVRQTFENLLLPAADVERLTASRDAAYGELARLLMDEASTVVNSKWGPQVEASFAIGVQVRLIEQMLDTDADTFAKQEATEIRKSIAAIDRHSEAAGYPEPLGQTLKELGTALSIKPEYAAIRKSREIWTALIRKLEGFDEAMKLLPRSGG